MFGLLVFSSVVMNVSEKCRNRILGNIFGVSNVSVSDVSLRDEQIIFRLFSEGVFYQFLFLNYSDNNAYFKVASTKDIVNCLFFISNNYFSDVDCNISLVMKIICCQDELKIYQLMRLLL